MDEIEQEYVESSTKIHFAMQHSDSATQNFQRGAVEVKAEFEEKKMKHSLQLDTPNILTIPSSMSDDKETLKKSCVGSQLLGRYDGPLGCLVMPHGGLHFNAHSFSSIYSPMELSYPCIHPLVRTMPPLHCNTASRTGSN